MPHQWVLVPVSYLKNYAWIVSYAGQVLFRNICKTNFAYLASIEVKTAHPMEVFKKIGFKI